MPTTYLDQVPPARRRAEREDAPEASVMRLTRDASGLDSVLGFLRFGLHHGWSLVPALTICSSVQGVRLRQRRTNNTGLVMTP